MGLWVLCSSAVSARDVTLEERVAAQSAIERVYWSHRIWPVENAGAKPALETVMPASATLAKVLGYLGKSDALAEQWHRPISAPQLQAEVERMMRDTRNPRVLEEIFAALGDDPSLIAECLARPALAERLLRNWSSKEERSSDTTKFRTVPADGWTSQPSGGNADARAMGESPKSRLAAAARSSPCADDTWSEMDFQVADPRIDHTAVWTGAEMIVWGGEASNDVKLNNGGLYDPATDTWRPMAGGQAPLPRNWPESVWTGTEMIVWGGDADGTGANTGGRYNPVADAWTPTSTVNAPLGRYHHTMVWTGTEVIVWGGIEDGGSQRFKNGGRYAPSTDTWTRPSTINAPTARYRHTAIWTGSQMVVWGGSDGTQTGQALNTGGRYSPATDTWSPTSTGANLPAVRSEHVSVWTGHEMLVWGGHRGSQYPLDLGRYDPVNDSWAAVAPAPGAPSGRTGASAVWTGREMLVWGGAVGAARVGTGGCYDPAQNSWRPTSLVSAPAARSDQRAVWTGTEMIVWGGQSHSGYSSSSGGRYDPDTDTWVPTSTGIFEPRNPASAVWTGSEMLVWDGVVNTGGAYDPVIDEWRPMTTVGAPSARYGQTTLWTGREMIVWGGGTFATVVNTGGRYDPARDVWSPTRADATAPLPRREHTAVWTGRSMIVWGGDLAPSSGAKADKAGTYSPEWDTFTDTGGVYDPQQDTWMPSSRGTGVPQARVEHMAAWLNGRMIVWGGISDFLLSTGALYDPSNDTWQPMSVEKAPEGRTSASAVVTQDGDMIVWGGTQFGPYLNTGGRYHLASNEWSPTSTGASVPAPRAFHSAVWTGREMIVWGGGGQSGILLSSGARYSPASDTWTTTASTGAPSARTQQSTVWTGSEMIVWGGTPLTSTGARYCACPMGRLVYPDMDADGFGDPRAPRESCDGSVPAGYAANRLDCDDANPVIHPGAFEVCNGIDDECNGTMDDGGPDLCSDADPCTSDTCTAGACVSRPVVVPEVNDSLAVSKSSTGAAVTWSDSGGLFNVYWGSRNEPSGMYDARCLESGTLGPVKDGVMPLPGAFTWYLVSRRTVCGESGIGRNSDGIAIPNDNPCP